MASENAREYTVSGDRLHVVVRPGVGVPLVLCNGIGASLELLQPFVDELDPAIPVIRFDPPGIGRSPLSRRPYLLTTLAGRVTTLLTQLGYDTFDVLGISWGGGLAQQIAFQNPRRCRRLVLVSTATGWMMVPAHPKVLRKMITPRRYRDAGYATTIAAELYGGRLRTDPDRVTTLLAGHSSAASARGYLLQLLAGAGWTSLPFLGLIRQPTLILAGDDDPIIPLVNAKIMARLIPDARLHVYHDGHLGLVVISDQLAPEVTRFLRGDRQLDLEPKDVVR
ncbi:poly(3-hydroxyalkanoate) depolymerase [Nocardia sp. NPDC046763]|uniref:poly(3-hydroxyalkanoate) depolymerase n=1 Tax=Nocardia sp. NPDC046763 TaxID=3155256 RepID=UPI0033D7307A